MCLSRKSPNWLSRGFEKNKTYSATNQIGRFFEKKISGGGGTLVMELREYMDKATFCYYHESILPRQTGVFY